MSPSSHALFKLWSRRLWSRHRWLIHYGLLIIWLILLAIELLTYRSGNSIRLTEFGKYGLYIKILISLFLGAVPALIVLRELRSTNYDLIKLSPLTLPDIGRPILSFGFLYGAVPIAIFQFLNLIVSLHVYRSLSTPLLPLHYFLLLTGFIIAGFAIPCLVYIGALIIRNAFGVLVGILVPVLVMVGSLATIFFTVNNYPNSIMFNIAVSTLEATSYIFGTDSFFQPWFVIDFHDRTDQMRTNLLVYHFIKKAGINTGCILLLLFMTIMLRFRPFRFRLYSPSTS